MKQKERKTKNNEKLISSAYVCNDDESYSKRMQASI